MADRESARLAHLGSARLQLRCETGAKEMPLGQVRKLEVGSVIAFERLAGERFDVLLNEHPFASGEVVVVGKEAMALRVTEMADIGEVQS
ncbi:MAG: FliM/FliN family flagellar motor switch protein [Candidatus Latescibacterota bacterium]|nr:FliM/FliN family flagellar motor switch protein [Candidatus Latescibacterota bacterium]MEE2727984.1 FliM/FliN family flagellar motor switch protein [Candidatus Latescibacterota bacterium]